MTALSIRTVTTELLQAELRRRAEGENVKPACGSTGRRGTYNVPIHIFAVFLILIISTTACAFPVIARRFPSLPIPHRFIFLSRHFGTGVLIATAFIHLLPTAFISMTDPCLPRFWNEIYPPMPGFIAMVAVFVVVCIEQFFAMRGAKHSHAGTFEEINQEEYVHDEELLRSKEEAGHDTPLRDMGSRESLPQTVYDANQSTRSHDFSDDDEDDLDLTGDLNAHNTDSSESAGLNRPSTHKRHASTVSASPAHQDPQKMLLQCLLLEAGILFHSIFIGMAVSVATGTAFIVLLIAICFHQTFEGFALGARIANLIPALFDAKSPKPWLMCLAYGATTPIGQVIGLMLHRLYDPNSEVGLLTVGITNAISSGLLLFAGLVQLMAEDFLADASYKTLKGRKRIDANVAVACGGFLMAVVGAFA